MTPIAQLALRIASNLALALIYLHHLASMLLQLAWPAGLLNRSHK